MAMLRVSSYRKLFEDDSWSRNGGLSMQCAGQYRATVRSAAVDKCDCDKLDFVAAKAINREGLNQFVKDRTIIAALNDRLVKLIELARCFEEENESLECQIVELEDKLNSRQAFSSITSTVPDYSLDEVVERLRRERDEILCDTEELRKELECLMKEYEKAAQQRILFQQERQDVAEEVDAVTAGCLALREQVAIYKEQLANMEAQHETAVEDLLEPADGTTGAVAAIKFGSPDITPALDVKEYYCQLAENLQYECDAPSSAVVRSSDGKQLEAGGAAGSTVKALPKITDIGEMKILISELQKELAELEKWNEELEDEVEMKKAAYMDEIAELEV
ncbi:Vimentin [Collichthys lucidus]|uniref:Vimentin n=1 Tax=Collichthys lucidus TaxID=240159 RepID=A0A4U5UDT2_COLLU|nr:Vimentin [Collichthys lucidus]